MIAALHEVRTRALQHELKYRERLRGRVTAISRAREVQRHFQIQSRAALNAQAQTPQRGTPQRVRILIPGRRATDAENADQRIETIGARDAAADRRDGDFIAREAREVEFSQGERHLRGFPVVFRIVASHGALQFWKLAHHLAQEIAARQPSGAHGEWGLGTEHGRELFGQAHDSFGFLQQTAETTLKHHRAELLRARCQRSLAILVVEKCRITEARSDHAFIAVADEIGRRALDIADGHESIEEATVVRFQWKIFLIALHGRDQCLARHLQKVLIESADDRGRPLHQGRDLIQKIFIQDGPATQRLCRFLHQGFDSCAPLREARDDASLLLQTTDIFARGGKREARRAHETVATRDIAAGDAQDLPWHNLGAVQHHHPVHRAHEFFAARTPAHALGDREGGQRQVDQRWQELPGWTSCLLRAIDQPFAFIGMHSGQVFDGDPAGARKADGGRRRFAARRKRCAERGTTAFDGLRRLRARERGDHHGQAAWSRKTFDRGKNQAGTVQARFDFGGQAPREHFERLGWQFLGADFEQEVGGTHEAARAAVSACFNIGKPSASRVA